MAVDYTSLETTFKHNKINNFQNFVWVPCSYTWKLEVVLGSFVVTFGTLMKCFNELLFTHFCLVGFNLQIIPRINNSINGVHPKLEEALMARGA